MIRKFRLAGYAGLLVCSIAWMAEACGYEVNFRAYLGKNLWSPLAHDVRELGKTLPKEKQNYTPYAGMSASGEDAALQEVRNEYQKQFGEIPPFAPLEWPDSTTDLIRDMLRRIPPGIVPQPEADLLRCKIELRAVRVIGDTPELRQVQSCFETYLSQAKPPELTSEARGWLARTYFLRGKSAPAAKIYLEELGSTTSNIRRDRLLGSLSMLYPYLDRPTKLADDLDELFDTSAHAIYAANLATNSESAELSTELVKRLEAHRDLFRQGADSDVLTMILMRTAMRMGAPAALLRYAELPPVASLIRRDPEYNWMVGSARFQQKNYAAAETNLLVALNAKGSPVKSPAANALFGVYTRLKRPVDQLRAAFLEEAGEELNMDAAYLLDVQLTDSNLTEYLVRYAKAPDPETYTDLLRKFAATDLVRYALAVRSARQEDYTAAAKLFEELHATSRARRMREAGKLLAATKDASLNADAQLQALYDYGEFLANNSTGVFFNDSVWHGIQTMVFVPNGADESRDSYSAQVSNSAALSPEERSQHAALERKLRDDQEEYWRAFGIFDQVVGRAGPTPLGRKAAAMAIVCLRRIRTERFGRAKEIHDADLRLSKWVALNKG